MMLKKPKTLAEVLRHLADGGIATYTKPSQYVEASTTEFRFADGFQSRLPDGEWFPCYTSFSMSVEGFVLVAKPKAGGAA
jgi:hypothetical protein